MNQIQYISLYFLVASRAKLNMLNTVSKIRGQVKTTGYPQPEGLLGDCMLRYGHELGDHSAFGTTHSDTLTRYQPRTIWSRPRWSLLTWTAAGCSAVLRSMWARSKRTSHDFSVSTSSTAGLWKLCSGAPHPVYYLIISVIPTLLWGKLSHRWRPGTGRPLWGFHDAVRLWWYQSDVSSNNKLAAVMLTCGITFYEFSLNTGTVKIHVWKTPVFLLI